MVKILSFYDSISNHRTILLDASTRSTIGVNEFKVVMPQARRLSLTNRKSVINYINRLEKEIDAHKLQERLDKLTAL